MLALHKLVIVADMHEEGLTKYLCCSMPIDQTKLHLSNYLHVLICGIYSEGAFVPIVSKRIEKGSSVAHLH